MKRRRFLTAAGLAGYSLLVRVDEPSAQSPLRTPDEIRTAVSAVAPQANAPLFTGGGRCMKHVRLECDVLVAGGGTAGVCAAISAARHGAKVVLVQDRSRLGGNSSSEVKMHICGADVHGGHAGWREGGLIEELRLDDAVGNPQRCWELWDLLLYDKVVGEPNITLLLDTAVTSAEVQDGRILRAGARCERSESFYDIGAKLFIDCTGDARLGAEAGAESRWGREARSEFNESRAPLAAEPFTQGSSILFTSRDYGKPMPFTAPRWARKITAENLKFRGAGGDWEYGYWWIEWGGMLNTIRDLERTRFELLGIVLGVWDYVKNSGKFPKAANRALDWVGMMPGRRESRRLVGDHILTQHDLQTGGSFADAVCIGGWGLDEHPSSAFDDPRKPPFDSAPLANVYNIPFRSLYSRNISNLMMAGRNISATHVAFTSTRVMATCSVEGQAVGTAAAICARRGITPRQLQADAAQCKELQQTLLRDDQTIHGLKNEDPLDLARSAKVSASAERPEAPAANLVNGLTRDVPKPKRISNHWAAPLGPDGAWIALAWDRPQSIRRVQLTFNSGFERELVLSASDGVSRRVIRAAQPETVRDYSIEYRPQDSADWQELVRVEGNHQRLRRHEFEPVRAAAVRLVVRKTNGDALVRVFEMRCYG